MRTTFIIFLLASLVSCAYNSKKPIDKEDNVSIVGTPERVR
jgi:hypothetical protein